MSQCLTSAAHHMGTARLSPHERAGVVDPNLRVWQMHNLYLCDASVFPGSGNANPGLTICALALRLADHLARLP
jgi:choline dehydrogenase-like flavoprotein